jgi:glycosyltransferase involved in cell wall biosynthesis
MIKSIVRPPENGAILLPCFNHGDKLGGVIDELRKVLPSLPIVVVDDGSVPPLADIPGVTILRHPRNLGKGAALVTGVNHLRGTEYIVFIDSDGQHAASAVPSLIEALDGPPKGDLVIAVRDFFHDTRIPLRHRLANILLSLEFAILHGKYIPDVTNGLRVVRTHAFLSLGLRFQRYEVEIEMLSSMLAGNSFIRYVPDWSTRYGTPSNVGRGFRVTAALAVSMLRAH